MYRSLKQWLFAVVKIHKSLRNQNKNLPLLLGCRPGREPLNGITSFTSLFMEMMGTAVINRGLMTLQAESISILV